jgi:hypothetical protein
MGQYYKEIGRGTFGVVFAADDPEVAIQKTFKSNDTLAIEFEHGLSIGLSATNTAPYLARGFSDPIPRVPWYQASYGIQKPSTKDPWWIAHRGLFPSTNGDSVPTGIFLFERTPPVSRALQERLIRRYWETFQQQQMALDDEENTDCMIRPYLQERWAYHEERGRKRLNNSTSNLCATFRRILTTYKPWEWTATPLRDRLHSAWQ